MDGRGCGFTKRFSLRGGILSVISPNSSFFDFSEMQITSSSTPGKLHYGRSQLLLLSSVELGRSAQLQLWSLRSWQLESYRTRPRQPPDAQHVLPTPQARDAETIGGPMPQA